MKLYSWGANSHGQLGLDFNSEQCDLPQEVDTTLESYFDPANIKTIVGGGGHSLILTGSGLVYGCGWNSGGQLGCGHYDDRNIFSLVLPLASHKLKALACGWDWSAALTDWGELMTWGSNAYCQLGFPNTQKERLPCPGRITTPSLTQVACGMRHMAVVTMYGRVLVWGSSRHNALGVLDHFGKPLKYIDTPTEVAGLEDVVKIACGQHHTVALTHSGKIYVWGDNKYGQLGLDPHLYPTIVTPTELDMSMYHITLKSQLVSGWTHTAILTDDGKVINWGRNSYGQLGCHKDSRPATWLPQTVEGLDRVKTLCLGSEHNIALLDSGRVVSWGWNEHGNCGNGTQDVWQPQSVALRNSVCIGTGYGHSFAVAVS